MSSRRREHRLIRPYVVTDGRAHPTRNAFDVVTVVTTSRDQVAGLSPEKRRVMRLCQGGPLSVAEVAARLDLPISVTKVLLSDLVDSGHITTENPVPPQNPQNGDELALLQEVLNGLHARL